VKQQRYVCPNIINIANKMKPAQVQVGDAYDCSELLISSCTQLLAILQRQTFTEVGVTNSLMRFFNPLIYSDCYMYHLKVL
jgi:hypothetical protein